MPDVEAKSSATLQPTSHARSRRGKPLLSIRARLIVVALLAITPLMVERVRGLERARAERAELARAQVVDLVRGGAAAQREIISSMRAMLQVVARVFAKMPPEMADCNKTLADLTANVPWIRAAAVADTDGRVKCATESGTMGLNVGDRPYFQKALQSRDFSLSDYLVSRANQLPSLIASYPVVRDDGSVSGVVIASMNLRWIGNLAESAVERAGTSVAVVDGRGTLVAASADQKEFIGKNFADHALTRELLTGDEGTITTALTAYGAFWPMCACPGPTRGSPSGLTSPWCIEASTAKSALPTCS